MAGDFDFSYQHHDQDEGDVLSVNFYSDYKRDKGDSALIDHPFYVAGEYHWNIIKDRYECNDYTKTSRDTLHRVWIR